ncbi:MAG: hypothetical protein E7394_03130 [Ruminococcaceae bacterium]|nr:hypothetical protein [Oscillospiraceae bacterium]
MKLETLFKYAGYTLCFFLISHFGYWYEEKTDINTIRITGVEFKDTEDVIVELQGEVKYPGKYSVKKGTKVHSLIYRAGGLTEDGDPESFDADMIVIEPCVINVLGKSDSYVEAYFTHGEYSTENPCNINIATKDDLIALPKIGEITAENIINYRKVNGDFKHKSQIQNVDGIGKEKYENIKDIITVGGDG